MWDKLSMSDKARIMQLAVQSGITNLNQIREQYNKFAGGGFKKTLTDGSTLEYNNGKWYIGGKEYKGNITVKDSDGYYKRAMPDGTLAVQDVDSNGNPIKHGYIGGTREETQKKYWEQAPIIRHAVDSIAGEYGINPTILRDRLNAEGFTDAVIKDSNFYILDKKEIPEGVRSDYSLLNGDGYNNGFLKFGLDDTADYLFEGKVSPINERWEDEYNENEHGREVHSANGMIVKESMGLSAMMLKYMRDKAAEDYPGASGRFLDKAAGEYYNRGETGGRKYMKNKRGSL